MQWIILIGNEELTIDKLYSISYKEKSRKDYVNQDKIVVQYGVEHVFYEYTPKIINDYEPEDIAKIPFANPHFVMMIYTSEDLMKSILCQENFLKDIYIDDDSGSILLISRFIAGFKTKV